MVNLVPATPDFSYVIFANFISGIVCGLMFIPDILRLTFNFYAKL